MENEKVVKEEIKKEEITDESANNASGGYVKRMTCAASGCNNYVVAFGQLCPICARKRGKA